MKFVVLLFLIASAFAQVDDFDKFEKHVHQEITRLEGRVKHLTDAAAQTTHTDAELKRLQNEADQDVKAAERITKELETEAAKDLTDDQKAELTKDQETLAKIQADLTAAATALKGTSGLFFLPDQEFRRYEQHIQMEVRRLEQSIRQLLHATSQTRHSDMELKRIQDETDREIIMLETVAKELEAELAKDLTDAQKAIVTKDQETLKQVEADLTIIAKAIKVNPGVCKYLFN